MFHFPPRKILVPIDFSKASFAAWRLAREWADRFGSVLETVHIEVLPPVDAAPAPIYYTENYFRWQRKGMIALARKNLGAGIKIRFYAGDPPIQILRLARTHRPDLIIMGTHGRKGIERVLIGSVTEYVVRRSLVPVLAVHRRPRSFSSILAPVNFTPYGDYGFVYAAAVATALGARLTGLHVVEPPRTKNAPEARINDMIQRLPEQTRLQCGPQIDIRRGEAASGILRASKKHDLVVLVSHKKNWARDFVSGTTVEQVVRRSRAPVISVPNPNALGLLPTARISKEKMAAAI